MKRISLPVLISLAGHGFVLLVLVFWGIVPMKNGSDEPLAGGGGGSGVTVEIIGGTGEVGQKGRDEQAPEIAPTETPVKKDAKSKEAMTIKAKAPEKAKTGRPDGDGIAVGSSAPAGPGQGSGPAGPGSGSGGGTNAVLAQIRAKIERAKRYPMAARRMNMQGVAQVHFAINPEGQPSGLALKTSSGYPLLDDEALATIRRAAPFPSYSEPLEIGIRFEIAP